MKYPLIVSFMLLFSTITFGQSNEPGQNPPPPPPPPKRAHDATPVFRVVEKQPQYKGGYKKMAEFIQKNIKYPAISLELGEEGKVFVEFQISKKGKISNVKAVRSVSKELDAEAVRVIKLMPKWKPGKQRGKKVNCYFTVPINFRIG